MTERFSSNELAELLERSAWFRAAPADMRRQLIEAGRIECLAAGQRLFTRGDADDGLYCVLDGLVRIGAASSTGKEALLAVIEPVNWFGEIALFDARPRTHDAYAERDSELLHVPRAALAALLERTPAYWHVFGLLLTHKLRLAFEAIEEAALLPAAPRVARRLLLMAGGYGEAHALRRVLRVPQEDLAMMLALSRQTINQVLKHFETQGALKLGYAEIEIVDADKLRALANEAGAAS
ncbi:Crp/Fnr family transcriptional regulator [Paraburkholderia sp. Ac-20336]|uniref:Crp/Fnr family transcriptional regulator n=1 Tax=Burkholderiaceae TaxID=119060 RepID=UPI00141FF7F3|nr:MULTISPECIES: Crp/Fnr family transcriptional regulator [Burkholderiaceae]MBN3803461.1 Crp/Fnr family transcriptional regulator [Paraburkholderia sp. Ac-20336]MBN3845756.1 Crp/Fnr family transcriptional regulator [Paraburkholderia sp. Ac-20342]NIF51688.1 Crp/Fnr family transcriptional regulator [Burkholderia sp. Ax-1724]NIF76986.1 Crp/Fnr family transcriptional regulator [Paraburkholderia sp. Cy-641]